MMPGTIHAVWTVGSSVVHGSHNYNFATLRRTMISRYFDHVSGRSITNAEHLHAELWLQAMTVSIYNQLIHRDWELSQLQSLSHQLPEPSSVGSLLIMMTYPSLFTPELKDGVVHQITPFMRKSRKLVLQLCGFILGILQEVVEDEEEDGFVTSLSRDYARGCIDSHEVALERLTSLVSQMEGSGVDESTM